MAETTPTAERKGFFITPIGEPSSEARYRSDTVLAHILKPALCPEFVDVIERADLMADPGEITPAIVNAIVAADLIIADLSDANPNVYYELAIAHAFAKPVIHIIEQGHKPRFDVKDVRAFPYGLNIDKALAAKASIIDAATIAKERGNQPTLVSRAADLKAAASSDNPVERQLADLRELILDTRRERDAPNPYAAWLADTLRNGPRQALVGNSNSLATDALLARSALAAADAPTVAAWIKEFVAVFGPFIARETPVSRDLRRLLDAGRDPALVDAVGEETLLHLVDVALHSYMMLGPARLPFVLPPVGGN